MKSPIVVLALAIVAASSVKAQVSDPRRLADTISVEAEGAFDAAPDIAKLLFVVSVQEKELSKAYEKANAALQRILQLAGRHGVTKPDFVTGPFFVSPQYDWGDKKRKVRAYRIESQVHIRVRDFTKVGVLMNEAVSDDITEFRSVTYSLSDEEAAKQKAVAEATKHAEGRARAAVEQRGQKLGGLRHASVDVKLSPIDMQDGETDRRRTNYALEMFSTSKAPLPPPPVSPQSIRVSAKVQCVFAIQ